MPQVKWRVPLFDLELDEPEIKAVEQVLRSRWIAMGGQVQAFERAFAARLGVAETVAVTNATAGLHLALRLLNLEPGAEVICPSLTFVATANAIVYAGATPVFADVASEDDLTISPDQVAALVTPRTRAIMVMHYAGYPCDMGAIEVIARRHDLRIIEDAAHTPIGDCRGRPLGTIGDVGVFSFFSNKNLTTAEGGLVICRDPELNRRARLLRSHGMTAVSYDRYEGRAAAYDVVDVGYNYRMDDVRAAIGLAQLQRLDGGWRRRRDLTSRYRSVLAGSDAVRLPFQSFDRGTPAYHVLPVVLAPRGPERQEVVEELERVGVQTSRHYLPVHLFAFYREHYGCREGQLPVTEAVAARQITLPLYPAMRVDQVDYVCRALRTACGVSVS